MRRDQVVGLTLDQQEANNITVMEWSASSKAIEQCLAMGQSEGTQILCKNYVRILAIQRKDDQQTTVLVCGTHAFQPQYRKMGVSHHNGKWKWISGPEEGKGLCPFHPGYNATGFFAQDKRLYVGTVLDFGGIDPVIYRRPHEDDEKDHPLRTEQYDLKQLNEPHFVNSMEDDDYVYFFFRERACEVFQCGKVPDPRPGSTLVNDSTLLSEYAVNFIKLYPFMYDHVQPIYQEPIFVLSQDENNARLSRIVVDENITIEDGGIRDVIFVGTDDGRVLKIVYNEDEAAEKVNAVVVEELEVFGNAKRVVNMYRYREEGEPAKIVVIGDEQIKALLVHRCDLVKSCSDCVKLQDPYCAWDTIDNHCAKVGNGSNENKPFRYVQDVRSGKNLRCPEIMSHLGNAGESKGMILNAISEDSEPARRPQRNATIVGSRLPSHSESDGLLTSQKNELFSAGPMAATEGSLDENGKILITAVVCSVVFLMAGFLAGFQFNRQCRTAPDSYPALEK
ncbi:unnamed protein product [Darwinula stevensoni]|uniref:Semaphorin-1A n=1 Tax=Darwinula stevensoni TaxID=69355 RepID=A0A7R8XJL0_9CRUS|nr:unnamed protein product [Darwinula stevensoni]CAG0894309.1 unnamed protein product [Darwinula stevensoni]